MRSAPEEAVPAAPEATEEAAARGRGEGHRRGRRLPGCFGLRRALPRARARFRLSPTQKKHAAFLDEAQREYRAERSGLPSGAEKFYGDGYEEVEIPPPRALPPPIEGELLRVDAALAGVGAPLF